MTAGIPTEVTIFGWRIKIAMIALCCLVAQTTAAVVLTRYNKMVNQTPLPNGTKREKYSNSSLVVSTEVVKLIASLALVFIFDTVDKMRTDAHRHSRHASSNNSTADGSSSMTPDCSTAHLDMKDFTLASPMSSVVEIIKGAGGGDSTESVGGGASGNGATNIPPSVDGSMFVVSGVTTGAVSPSTHHSMATMSQHPSCASISTAASSGTSASTSSSSSSSSSVVPPFFSRNGLSKRFAAWKSIVYAENFKNFGGTMMLCVPALLYTVQNNVIYVALDNLEATTFQVGYQSKVVTTAVLSVLMLNRSLSSLKWLSLFILTIGIVLTQLQPSIPSAAAQSTAASLAVQSNAKDLSIGLRDDGVMMMTTTMAPTAAASSSPASLKVENPIMGMVAVLIASFCSAFAGVYFEKILKGTAPSVWVRNAQLAFFSMVIGLVGYAMSVNPDEPLRVADFVKGYDSLVLVLIAVQALGGLIIACVVKYADNILKGFATAMSIVLCGVLSAAFMGFIPNTLFVVGSSVVILATMLYSKPDKR